MLDRNVSTAFFAALLVFLKVSKLDIDGPGAPGFDGDVLLF